MKSEEFFCFSSLRFEDERKIDKTKLLIATKVKRGNQLVHPNLIALSLLTINCKLLTIHKVTSLVKKSVLAIF